MNKTIKTYTFEKAQMGKTKDVGKTIYFSGDQWKDGSQMEKQLNTEEEHNLSKKLNLELFHKDATIPTHKLAQTAIAIRANREELDGEQDQRITKTAQEYERIGTIALEDPIFAKIIERMYTKMERDATYWAGKNGHGYRGPSGIRKMIGKDKYTLLPPQYVTKEIAYTMLVLTAAETIDGSETPTEEAKKAQEILDIASRPSSAESKQQLERAFTEFVKESVVNANERLVMGPPAKSFEEIEEVTSDVRAIDDRSALMKLARLVGKTYSGRGQLINHSAAVVLEHMHEISRVHFTDDALDVPVTVVDETEPEIVEPPEPPAPDEDTPADEPAPVEEPETPPVEEGEDPEGLHTEEETEGDPENPRSPGFWRRTRNFMRRARTVVVGTAAGAAAMWAVNRAMNNRVEDGQEESARQTWERRGATMATMVAVGALTWNRLNHLNNRIAEEDRGENNNRWRNTLAVAATIFGLNYARQQYAKRHGEDAEPTEADVNAPWYQRAIDTGMALYTRLVQRSTTDVDESVESGDSESGADQDIPENVQGILSLLEKITNFSSFVDDKSAVAQTFVESAGKLLGVDDTVGFNLLRYYLVPSLRRINRVTDRTESATEFLSEAITLVMNVQGGTPIHTAMGEMVKNIFIEDVAGVQSEIFDKILELQMENDEPEEGETPEVRYLRLLAEQRTIAARLGIDRSEEDIQKHTDALQAYLGYTPE